MFRGGYTKISAFSIVGLALSLILVACEYPDQTDSIDIGNIRDMAWQDDRYLWVCGSNGVARWDVRSANVTKFSYPCSSLLIASDGAVWVSGGRKVNRYQGQSWRTFTHKDGLVQGYNGAQLIEASDGSIWLGSSGLSRYDPIVRSWQVFIPPLPDVPPALPPGSVGQTRRGEITALLQATDGAIWAASTGGVIRLDLKGISQRIWTAADGLAESIVEALLETRDGAIWAGTDQGISRWNGNTWETLPYATNPDTDGARITDILLERSDGTVWATTWEGVARWDGSAWQAWPIARGLPRHQGVRVLLEMSDGSLWAGTWGGGVGRWDGGSWRMYTTAEGLSANRIQVLLESPEGTLWAGTFSGINCYDPTTDRWQPFPARPEDR